MREKKREKYLLSLTDGISTPEHQKERSGETWGNLGQVEEIWGNLRKSAKYTTNGVINPDLTFEMIQLDDVREGLRNWRQENPKFQFQLNTLGFGEDLRNDILLELAQMGGGTYTFIPDSGTAGKVFVHPNVAQVMTSLTQKNKCTFLCGFVLYIYTLFFFVVMFCYLAWLLIIIHININLIAVLL